MLPVGKRPQWTKAVALRLYNEAQYTHRSPWRSPVTVTRLARPVTAVTMGTAPWWRSQRPRQPGVTVARIVR